MEGCVSSMCILKHDAVTPLRSLLVEHANVASGAFSGNVSVELTTREFINRGFRAVHYDLGCGISCCAAPGPEGPHTL